tara:strand:+ start:3159 stop:5057 length:1899 start_codon:yes stop_codon:yes gene_type:complete
MNFLKNNFFVWLSFSGLAVSFTLPASGQEPAGGGGGSYESNTLVSLVDRVFNVESDSLDPEEGTLNWKGRSFQLGQGRMMRARFVRYLNTPVNTMDSRLYLSLLEQIHGRLSTLNQANDPEDIDDPWKPVISSWKLLFQASEFDVDGGNSTVIANLVYDNWRDRELFQNQRFREDIEAAERDRLEVSVITESRKEENRRIHYTKELSRLNEEGVGAPTIDGSGMSSLSQAMKSLAEQEAQLAAQGLKIEEIGLKARLKMQSQIISFLSQRRFQHALILSSFYRTLFKSSAQDLEVGGEQLISYMPELEMIPTVDSLEFIALQALDDVRTGMTSVNNAYDQGQLISALERLQETFFLGEYSLDVVLFPEEKKRVLRELYFDLDEARRLAELKDYDALEELILSISRLADDFPDREAISAVRVAKQASRMKLLGARGALLRGEVTQAEAMLDEAFQIWPLNPDIENFMTAAVSGADHVSDFDVDYKAGDYRRIFDQREEYISALSGDPVRAEQLRESIETVQTIDFAIRAAEERLDRGEPYAAWEVLKEIEDTANDDRLYHRTLSTVVPGIAQFVTDVEEAEKFEREGKFAASLTKYAAAQEYFPASQVVSRGIERMAGQMLDQAQRIEDNRGE